MSISGAFSNARSGLALNARAAELVSSNIANALTPNHARMEITATTLQTGGVTSGRTERTSDPVTLAALLGARAQQNDAMTSERVQTAIAALTGENDGSSGLATSINRLGIALSQASAMPDNHSALQAVISSAGEVVDGFNAAANGLRQLRNMADASISDRVGRINDNLASIDTLNAKIVSSTARRQDTAFLEQQREALLNDISKSIPLSVVERKDGQIAIFSTRGATLLDGAPAKIGFAAAGFVPDDATISDGSISGLTLSGVAIDTGDRGLLSGGGLGADFTARDRTVPAAQAALDRVAASLMQRLQAADPTLAAGEGGLISDGVNGFDPQTVSGAAARMTLNPGLQDPSAQTGLLTTGFGMASSSTGLLSALAGALTREDADLSGAADATPRDVAGHMSRLSSDLHVSAYGAEQESTRLSARAAAADETHGRSVGVNSDQELQKLLAIENAYAANARVIATADAMMQQLLEL